MADNAIATTGDNGSRLDPFKQLARNPATRQLVLLVAGVACVFIGSALIAAALQEADARCSPPAAQSARCE